MAVDFSSMMTELWADIFVNVSVIVFDTVNALHATEKAQEIQGCRTTETQTFEIGDEHRRGKKHLVPPGVTDSLLTRTVDPE